MAAGLLTACSDDMSDLRQYVGEVKSRPGGGIEPLPEMKPFETFEYPGDISRDPFARLSFAEPKGGPEAATDGPQPDPTRPREVLEDFELDSLAYVGTLQRNGQAWALVKDPSGIIHRVQNGNHMGRNYGRIERITPTTIEVRELVPNERGGWIEREASLALND